MEKIGKGIGITLLLASLIFLAQIGTGLCQEKTILFVHFSPMTGKASPWGVSMDRGFKFAADDINAKGGVSIKGERYKFKVLSYDTQYNSAKAVEAANKAIFSDHAKFVCAVGAGIMSAVQPILERNKVLNIGLFAAGKKFTNPENPLTFRIMPSSDMICFGVTPEVYRRYKINRAAFIMPDDDMGRSDGDLMRALIKKISPATEIVREEYYDRETIDFSPIITRVLMKNPDILHTNASAAGSLALISKVARGAGFTGPIENVSGAVTPEELLKSAGSVAAIEGNLIRYWAQPPSQLWSKLNERHQKQYGEPGPILQYLAYPALIWVAQSMEKAQSIDPEKVAEVLRNFKGEHPDGDSRMGGIELGYGINTQFMVPVPVSIIKKGKAEMLFVAKP